MILRPFDGQRLGEVIDASAGGAAVSHAGEAAPEVHEDIDDSAAMLAHIMQHGGFCHLECAGEVGFHYCAPAIRADRFSRTDKLAAAIVDQPIDSPIALQ